MRDVTHVTSQRMMESIFDVVTACSHAVWFEYLSKSGKNVLSAFLSSSLQNKEVFVPVGNFVVRGEATRERQRKSV